MKYLQKFSLLHQNFCLSNYTNLTVGQKYEECVVVKNIVFLKIKIICKHVQT
jgi:hypothetical protein